MQNLLSFEESLAWMQAHQDEMVADLQSFARIRSVSRADLAEEGAPFGKECRTMLDFALKRAGEMGFETQDHEGYCGSAILGDGENAIGICAHLDVVPEGDKWTFEPYGATHRGDFLIGRGVGDNKSSAILGLYVMKMLREKGIPLKHGIRVLMGCSEETGMEDYEYYVKHYPVPVVSLVADASYPVNYAQKGSLRSDVVIDAGEQLAEFSGGEVFNMVAPHATALVRGVTVEQVKAAVACQAELERFTVEEENGCVRIRVLGKAAHAAFPEGGINALHLLARMLEEGQLVSGQSLKAVHGIRELTDDIYGEKAGVACEDPDSGKSTVVCGLLRCEEGKLSLTVDGRLSVVAKPEEVAATYERYAATLGFASVDTSTTPPVFIALDDPKVVALQALYKHVTGDDAQPYSMGGGTYSRVMPRSITYGPSFPQSRGIRPDFIPAENGGGHAPDEFLYIPNWIRGAALYACAVLELDALC